MPYRSLLTRLQQSFERKSSLFSLALAEILIINLWFQDIGRWDAANYGLLKTVFELNLQLFGKHRYCHLPCSASCARE